MIALYRKELRVLFPVFLLGAFLVSGDLLSRPFSERLDEATYSTVASVDPGEGAFIGFFQFLIAFVVAYAAFGREHDERTIELLYALPISRPQIFFAKVLAGLTTIWGVAVLGQITNWILVASNPSPFAQAQLSLDLMARVAFLHGVTGMVGYGHGLFASFFRRFGILPYVFLGFGIALAVELYPPIDWLDPLRLARTEYAGRTLLIPWLPIAGHLAVSALLGALAYPMWMGNTERARLALVQRSLGATLLFGGGVVAATVTALVVFTVIAVREYGDSPPPDPSEAPAPTEMAFGTAEASSEHYAFVYPENLRNEALVLVGRSDRILEGVSGVVGASRIPSITVDLAEESGHHEGIAAGARIRMGLVDQDRWRLAHVLAHESTHVLQNQESELHLGEHGATTRFFVEGGAEWVAFEACSSETLDLTSAEERISELELRALSRQLAAVSAERQSIRFEDLLDDASFRARFDTALAYPLGETLTEGIARGCGDAAVGNLMRAFARPDAPQNATGEVLFRDALQSFGCDLERVIDGWDAVLVETRATDRAALDAIPRIELREVRNDRGVLVLVAELDRPHLPFERYYVRIRRNSGASDEEVIAAQGIRIEGTERIEFRSGSAMLLGERFEVLFSLEIDPRAFPYSERWQSITRP